jgi:hypothetical protein
MNRNRKAHLRFFRGIFLSAFALFAGLPIVFAKAPLTVTEANGVVTPLDQDGLYKFVDDLRNNPRSVTLNIYGHPFSFNVIKDGAGQAVSIQFVSPELGINKTFTGSNTGSTMDATKDFLKSEEFLAPFFRLINVNGPGSTFSGNPNGTIESNAQMSFGSVLLQNPPSAEEKELDARDQSQRDFTVGLGFSKFDSDGFDGSRLKASPAYTFKMGEKKQEKLTINLPMERITVEGLQTYRLGSLVQFVHPVELPHGVLWRVAPDVSYSFLGSLDIPSYSGTIGGGLTNVFSKEVGPYFGNAGGYYSYFSSLGGIDTKLSAHLFSYGTQFGRRFGKRWVSSVYVVGVTERLNYGSGKDYQTGGVSLAYKIFNRFNIEVSVNRTYNLPGYNDTSFSFGSGWSF